MAGQLAPLATTELIPYFLKMPFSWAITIGEQSVSAIIPNLMSAVSGASLGVATPVVGAIFGGDLPLSAELGASVQPLSNGNAALPKPTAAADRNSRRETADVFFCEV